MTAALFLTHAMVNMTVALLNLYVEKMKEIVMRAINVRKVLYVVKTIVNFG